MYTLLLFPYLCVLARYIYRPYNVLDCNCTYKNDTLHGLKGKMLDVVKKYMINNGFKKENNIAVSLSLGVDSAVLISIIKYLGYKTIALHINYNNRNESNDEKEFIINWCKENEITIEIYNVGYKRNDCKRDVYETETRKLRYKFYKDMIVKYNLHGIFIGHHKGDVVENVFTNSIAKGRSVNDLCVINSESIVNDVKLFKPFVNNYKKDIFNFAHKNELPYFKDTTPNWSNRWFMRNVVFPLLKKKYGNVFNENLYNLGKEASEMWDLCKNKIDAYLKENITRHKYGIVFKCDANYNSFFWKHVLIKVLHSNGIKMISNKVFKLFMEKIKEEYCCIQLCRELIFYKDKNSCYLMPLKIRNKLMDINKKEIKITKDDTQPLAGVEIHHVPDVLKQEYNIVKGIHYSSIKKSEDDMYYIQVPKISDSKLKILELIPKIIPMKPTKDIITIKISI